MSVDAEPGADGTRTRRLLVDLWHALAEALLKALSVPSPKASALEVARQFLKDNRITIDTVGEARHQLELLQQLDRFDFDPETKH